MTETRAVGYDSSTRVPDVNCRSGRSACWKKILPRGAIPARRGKGPTQVSAGTGREIDHTERVSLPPRKLAGWLPGCRTIVHSDCAITAQTPAAIFRYVNDIILV